MGCYSIVVWLSSMQHTYPMEDALAVACIAVVLFVAAWLFTEFRSLWNGSQAQLPKDVQAFSKIPGPRGLPWFGSVIQHIMNAKSIQHACIKKKLFEQYGPIFKETVMGKTHVYIQSPTDLEAVFKAEGKFPKRSTDVMLTLKEYFRTRNVMEAPILDLLNNEEWSRVRKAMASKLLRPQDVGENIQSFCSMTRDAVSYLAKTRGDAGFDNEIPNLEDVLYYFSAETMGIIVFDSRIGLFDDPPNSEAIKMVKAVYDSFKLMGKLNGGLESFLLKYTCYKTSTFKTMCDVLDVVLKTSDKLVGKTMKKLQEKAEDVEDDQGVPLLTYLLTKSDLQMEEATLGSIIIFRTGVEVAATTAIWLLYELARNPRVQEKVYEEVSSLIKTNEDFTAESFGKLHYTKACVRETLRLYPDPGFWSRVLSRDTVLSGYHIPAGTPIRYSNYLSGHSEEIFSNPLEFKPERWLNTEGNGPHPYASIPFGFGRRMCIGRRVAQAELCLLAAMIAQRFVLEFHEKPVEITSEFVLIPDRPMRIKFLDRE